MKKIIKIIGITAGVIALVAVALIFWRNSVIEQRRMNALQEVEELLENFSAREALVLINARPADGDSAEMNRRWFAAEVEACAQLGLIARLQTLLSMNPDATLANEDAALILARAYLHGGEPNKGLDISESWKSKSERPHLWHAFEVDVELFAGQPDRAFELLSTQKFEGAGDSVRLSRLALLTVDDDPAGSWNLLADAYEANPRDTDVRSFRGQILETLGSNRLARVEYVAAHVAAPQNFVLRDQLAEFYRRQGSFRKAQQTWAPALTNRPPAFLPLKALFWSRVAIPADLPDFDLSDQDPLTELVSFISGFPKGAFWDESQFVQLNRVGFFDRERQEVFWLRLIHALQESDLDTAAELVRSNPFRDRVYDLMLDRALAAWLSWRETGLLDAYGIDLDQVRINPNRHSFLNLIGENMVAEKANRGAFRLNPELEQIFKSESAAGLIFLTAGWLQAGLELIGDKTWESSMPQWIPYAVTQAKRTVEGPESALAYAQKQPGSNELDLVQAELMLTLGKMEEGMSKLKTLQDLSGPVGYRSAWLLSVDALKKGEHENLASIITGQPQLSEKPVGKEMLAKSALMQGKTNQAAELYQSIVQDSVEAKAYLASLAFQQKDYPRARQLTEELILMLPDELSLRANLEQIAEAEANAETNP